MTRMSCRAPRFRRGAADFAPGMRLVCALLIGRFDMRNAIAGFAVLAALALAACVIAPGEIAKTDGGTSCASGQRFFNGGCRVECAATSDCAAGTTCTTVDLGVDKGSPVCIAHPQCAYLESDTECIGVGTYTVYTRFGMETRPYDSDPYWADPRDITPYNDPYFEEAPYGPPYASDLGCRGNARWVTVPPASDPACGQPHTVTRCRRLGTRCAFVPGSTLDFPAP